MINWILGKMIARMDKDINNYRLELNRERHLFKLYISKGDTDTAQYCYENTVAIASNAAWCIKWRNRMARRVGIPTIMAW